MGLIYGDEIGSTPVQSFTALFPDFATDPIALPNSTDPFTLTPSNGFLPFKLPVQRLPAPFTILSDILDKTPILKKDGSPGLLATYSLGSFLDAADCPLPDLTDVVDQPEVKGDLQLITALFRDYSFLASSYLLEPCWEKYSKSMEASSTHLMAPVPRESASAKKPDLYGLGRQKLPHSIAGPLVKCGEILDIPPFMSYAASYALYNYYLEDPGKGHENYSNIRLIRAFEKGLDPKSSEAGFILTHIHMVAQTGGLVEGSVNLLNAIENAKGTAASAEQTNRNIKDALSQILSSMQIIEENMEAMWHQSLPKDYITYRTFIFGITNQSMFPDGVVYEGCFDNVPQFFRGESGANDSIVPLLDNLCEVPMPKNPLTEILREFREYRPRQHRQFLSWVLGKSAQLQVRQFLCDKSMDKEIVVMYLRVLDHIRSFRWRHWMFAREYIIKRTSHPTATGGSPIVTWLPNQLGAVMELMEQVYENSGLKDVLNGEADAKLDNADRVTVKKLMENVTDQKTRLAKEVKKYCEERGV